MAELFKGNTLRYNEGQEKEGFFKEGGFHLSKEKTIQSEVGSYVSALLRTHFGKGPSKLYITLNPPFITIQFQGFLAPMERLLVKRKEKKRVLETRDLMMTELKPEIIQGLREAALLEVSELYVDWDLEKETGMMIGILEEELRQKPILWPEEINEDVFKRKINEASYKAEKVPESTDLYWLSDWVILVRRTGILVQIEKELIKNGYMEELKLSKRPLERRLMLETALDTVIKQPISDIFLDWNFEADIGYTAFVLGPKQS